ncbi:MAG: hypothetical protein J6T24_00355 [Clostridia bacterium]|nr:hypothetical protein [Clostridia bacterium]
MECLKNKLARVCEVLGGLKNLQVTVKGNAEVSLHTKATPDTPKARAEIIEDGATIDLTDIVLVGVALAAVGSVVSLICDIFE